ncbi:MAG TPA: hypothetical protein VGO62_20670 [Myxococcota bacterium]|jgi:hypothetical protein
MLRTSLVISWAAFGSLSVAVMAAVLSGCPAAVEGEGEGEGAAGEGEGAAAGEGEGAAAGEGEGAAAGEGEGEGAAGEGEGEGGACAVAPTCASAPTSTLTFNAAGGSNPAVVIDNGAPISVVGGTRQSVVAALGAGVNDGASGTAAGNVFHVDYCAAGIQVQYVDGDGTFDAASGAGANTDVIARIQTLPGASLTAPSVLATGSYSAGGGTVSFDAAKGVEEISDAGGALQSLVLFQPQPGDNWGSHLALNLSPDHESLGSLSLGDTFGDAIALLGDNFDADGTTEIDVGITITVRIVIWASTGIRLAGICQHACDDNVTLNSIDLAPPFLGVDGSGVGLGASKADLEAELGAGDGPDSNGITVYGSTGLQHKPLGVLYVQDSQCTERVATVIMGYTPPG